MKFLADINIAQSVIRFLRDLDHDVLDAKKEYLRSQDTEIIKIAQRDIRIILTRDKDFENLIKISKFRIGAIVFRLKDPKPANIILFLDKLLKEESEGTISGSLTTVRDDLNEVKPFKISVSS